MTDFNLTFKEAEKVVNFPSFSNAVRQNKYSVLQNLDSDFPTLTPQKRSLPNPRAVPCQPRAPQPSASEAPPTKRKKPITPEPVTPSAAPSTFRFCGPPIKNNPHSVDESELTSKLTVSLVDFIASLVNRISEKKSQLDKHNIQSQISQIVIDIVGNKSGKNKRSDDNSSMER